MTEGRDQGAEDAAIIRRFLSYALVLIVLIGSPMLLLWLSAPKHDPRLLGAWRGRGMTWRFHPDGQLERIADHPPPGGLEPWRLASWRTKSDQLYIGGPQPGPAHQILRWLNPGMSPPSYQILEVTDSTLRLRRSRPLPAVKGPTGELIQLPDEEVLSRSTGPKQ